MTTISISNECINVVGQVDCIKVIPQCELFGIFFC